MQQRRNSKRNLTTGTLVVLLTLGVAGIALAQGPGAGRGGAGRRSDGPAGPEMRWERMAARLDLTAEQQEAIRTIRDEAQAKGLELRKKIMRLRNEKQGEMMKDAPATKKVLELTREIGAARTEMQTKRMETRLAIRKLLTTEQRDKMLMFGDHRGRRGGSHPGRNCGNRCDGDGPHRDEGRGGRGNR